MNIYNNAKYYLSKASFLSYPRQVVVGQRHMGKYPIHIISECYEPSQVRMYKQAHLILLVLQRFRFDLAVNHCLSSSIWLSFIGLSVWHLFLYSHGQAFCPVFLDEGVKVHSATSMAEAKIRYTFRLQEQDNIWESYQLILQRLRNYCDNPYLALPDGTGVEDETQLFALREGLTNLCAHSDYFSPMHATIRVFTDRIELQNPGRFMFPLSELRMQIHSMPRNPSLIKFFRYAKLGENAGYGIDKMLKWEEERGKVEFSSTIVSSTITFWFSGQVGGKGGGQVSGQVSGQVQKLINTILDGVYTISEIQEKCGIKSRRYVRENLIIPAIEQGFLLRLFPDKPNSPKQKYYLSEEGLKLVKTDK